MPPSASDRTPDAATIRTEEREAIHRLARSVAADAARANGFREQADVSANFIDFILGQAFAARDAELEQISRRSTPDTPERERGV